MAAPTELQNIGAEVFGPFTNAGTPSTGTDEVQTITLGGTWLNTETFRIVFDGYTSSAITWTATDATLVTRINTALNAMTNLGTSQVVATAGTVSSGLGTILLTFSGNKVSKKDVPLATATKVTAAGTIAIATTTPGVNATYRDCQLGALLLDTSGKKLYINTSSTAGAPTWTVVGAQS